MALQQYSGIAPSPGTTLSVFLAGTQNFATIFADADQTPLANPFTADQFTGAYTFWADDDNGPFDVVVGGVLIPGDVLDADDLQVSIVGVSPNRTVTLFIDDNGTQVVLAQVIY